MKKLIMSISTSFALLGARVACALPDSFVPIKEIQDKNIIEVFTYWFGKALIAMAAVFACYAFLQVGITVLAKFQESRKSQEWGGFLSTVGFAAAVLIIAIMLFAFGEDTASSKLLS